MRKSRSTIDNSDRSNMHLGANLLQYYINCVELKIFQLSWNTWFGFWKNRKHLGCRWHCCEMRSSQNERKNDQAVCESMWVRNWESERERERKRECGERLCSWLIGSSKAHLKNWVILQYNFSLNKNIKILISVRLSKWSFQNMLLGYSEELRKQIGFIWHLNTILSLKCQMFRLLLLMF